MFSEVRQLSRQEPSSLDLSSICCDDSGISLEAKPELSSINYSENVEILESTAIGSSLDSNYRVLESQGNCGISSLTDQLMSQLAKNSFSFNMMVVGQTGIGKSTLLDSLFGTNLAQLGHRTGYDLKVDIEVNYFNLSERNVKLKLGLIESKGFGDHDHDQFITNQTLQPIVNYIDKQYERYLIEEQKKIARNKSTNNDTRVHVCLYLIPSKGMRAIDLVAMKELGFRTNLVPVITKADTLTREEFQQLKTQIISDIKSFDIKIYYFPIDDIDVCDTNSQNNALLPFAVMASNQMIRIDTRVVRARQYPWGTIEVLEEKWNDFVRLRDMIIRTNMEDLREKTLEHYEHYRQFRLKKFHSDCGNISQISDQ